MSEPRNGSVPPELVPWLERMDDLIQRFEEHPDAAVQGRVTELLQCIDMLHRTGLRRIGELLSREGLLAEAHSVPEVRLLFELYDVGETGARARVEAVLDPLRSALEARGGQVTVLETSSEVLRVRLVVPRLDAPEPLSPAVERFLRSALPDLPRIEVVEERAGPPPGFVPLTSLVPPPLVWHTVLRIEELPEAGVRGAEIAGERILLARLDAEVRAYANACPGTPLPLHQAEVQGLILHCPWHHCRFDLRDGRRLEEGPGLAPVPVAVEGGEIRVGISERAAA